MFTHCDEVYGTGYIDALNVVLKLIQEKISHLELIDEKIIDITLLEDDHLEESDINIKKVKSKKNADRHSNQWYQLHLNRTTNISYLIPNSYHLPKLTISNFNDDLLMMVT